MATTSGTTGFLERGIIVDWIFSKERLPDKVCECYVYLPDNEEEESEGWVTIMKFYPAVCTIQDDPDFGPRAYDMDGSCVIDYPNKDPDAGYHPAWVLESKYYDTTYEYDIEDVLCWQLVPKWPDPPTKEERRAHE